MEIGSLVLLLVSAAAISVGICLWIAHMIAVFAGEDDD